MKFVIRADLRTESEELEKLFAEWSSCVRYAYSLLRKGEECRSIQYAAKVRYPSLNGSYIYAATRYALQKHRLTLHKDPIVFGGKDLFEKFCSGKISRAYWQFVRDRKLYIKGAGGKPGNSTLSVEHADNRFQLRAIVKRTGITLRDVQRFPLSVEDTFVEPLSRLLSIEVPYNVCILRVTPANYKVRIDADANYFD
jgi:hypothetical protein